ncbi:hypothetical protein KA001_00175 [Patescibacteria group bacterium]|nr:hypothetical protein [Patescibacteria group bacterium]
MSTFTPPSYQRPAQQVSKTTLGILGMHPANPQAVEVDLEIYRVMEEESVYYSLEGRTNLGALEQNPAAQ